MLKEIEYPSYIAGGAQRVSWGAVFAGATISLATLFCLTTLGIGIGLVSAPAAESASGLAAGMGVGAGAWMLLSGIASYYAGGWIAGRLTGIARVSESVIHGVLSWGVGTLVVAFVLATAAIGAFGAAAEAVGASLGLAGRAAMERPEAVDDLRRFGERLQGGQGGDAGGARDVTGARGGGGASAADAAAIGGAASRYAGAAGLFTFLMLACNAAAAGFGARGGTRVLKPIPMPSESRRERVGSM